MILTIFLIWFIVFGFILSSSIYGKQKLMDGTENPYSKLGVQQEHIPTDYEIYIVSALWFIYLPSYFMIKVFNSNDTYYYLKLLMLLLIISVLI